MALNTDQTPRDSLHMKKLKVNIYRLYDDLQVPLSSQKEVRSQNSKFCRSPPLTKRQSFKMLRGGLADSTDNNVSETDRRYRDRLNS